MDGTALTSRYWRQNGIVISTPPDYSYLNMIKLRCGDRVPRSAVNQLRRLCTLLQESLSTLEAVILHGSAAMAGFEPGRSDLDVLVIVNCDPGSEELAQSGQAFLTMSGNPHPLEASVIVMSDLKNWRHPCPYLLHFGEEERRRFESDDIAPLSATDKDLAMHLVVARTRGIDLLGTFELASLPEVPRADFLSAVLSDFEWAEEQDGNLKDYTLLNACRTLAYLQEGVVLSKSEGRQWCTDRNIDTAAVVALVTRELRRELMT